MMNKEKSENTLALVQQLVQDSTELIDDEVALDIATAMWELAADGCVAEVWKIWEAYQINHNVLFPVHSCTEHLMVNLAKQTPVTPKTREEIAVLRDQRRAVARRR